MATDRDAFKRAVKDACDAQGPRGFVGLLAPGRKTKNQTGDNVFVLCFSPGHVEDDPSCSVHHGAGDGGVAFKCQSCGVSGDVFSLVALARGLDPRGDFGRVVEEAGVLVGLRLDDPRFISDAPRRTAQHSSVAAPVVVPPIAAKVPPNGPTPDEVERIWEHVLPDLDYDGWEYVKDRAGDDAAGFCRGVPPAGVKVKGRNGKIITGDGGKETQFLFGKQLAVALRNAAGRIVAIQARNFVAHDKAKGTKHGFSVIGPSDAGVFGHPERLKEPGIEWVILAEGLTDFLAAIAAVGPENKTALVLGIAGVNNAGAFAELPLQGKRVVLALDADEEGDKCSLDLYALLQPKGARCSRARPSLGCKDLCDLVKAGQDLKAFFRQAKAFRRVRPNVVSVVAADDLESDARHEEIWNRGIPFEIELLDRALGGIFANDLVLVGSDTGVGKTELLSATSCAIAQHGRRVRYFALEAYRGEITDRLMYRELLAQGYPALARAGVDPYFSDYVSGQPIIHRLFQPFKEAAREALRPLLANLFIEYRMRNFTVEDFISIVEDTEGETDVFVLDHVHYVDVESDNENKGLTNILQKISDVSLRVGRPVILAAHVRKNTDPKNRRVIPTLDDFQGTSNLSKIVTKALMLARAPESMVTSTLGYLKPTFMQVQKYRQDGGRTNTLGVVDFNLRTGRYADEFQLGKIKGAKYEGIPYSDWPHWAKRPLLKAGEQERDLFTTPADAAPHFSETGAT